MAKQKDSDYYEFLDHAKRDLHEELGLVYSLDNLSKLDYLQKRIEKLNQEVLSKYKEGEFKIEAYPENDQMFVYLPLSSMFRVNSAMINLGFRLFHVRGVGHVH